MRLIDADALIQAVEQGEGISWERHGKDDLCVRKKYINNAPTVEHERPKGEWVEPSGFNFDEFYGKVYKCTNCNEETLGCDCHNYCPNCGADMKGGKE